MIQILSVLSDRGSKYAVTGFQISQPAEIKSALTTLCRKKKFTKATHNTWGVIFADGQRQKNDGGESGAGLVILNMLEQHQLVNHLVIVSRWYGGVKLGGDRFRHVQQCVRAYFQALDS
jgi:Uncharacterized conserved protein